MAGPILQLRAKSFGKAEKQKDKDLIAQNCFGRD
jgi:hypothetical protein